MDEEGYETYPTPQQPVVMGGHTSEGALMLHIDSKEIIDNVKHVLKCEIPSFNSKGQKVWTAKEGEAIINDLGINRIMAILQSRLNKIFIFSDLEQENVENITIKIGQTLIDNVYYNWKDYEIKDTADASLILDLVTDTVYATLRKGYQSNYLKFLRTTSQISEVQHRSVQGFERVQQPPQRGGALRVFSKMFGGRPPQ